MGNTQPTAAQAAQEARRTDAEETYWKLKRDLSSNPAATQEAWAAWQAAVNGPAWAFQPSVQHDEFVLLQKKIKELEAQMADLQGEFAALVLEGRRLDGEILEAQAEMATIKRAVELVQPTFN